jgi:hypothetical protein
LNYANNFFTDEYCSLQNINHTPKIVCYIIVILQYQDCCGVLFLNFESSGHKSYWHNSIKADGLILHLYDISFNAVELDFVDLPNYIKIKLLIGCTINCILYFKYIVLYSLKLNIQINSYTFNVCIQSISLCGVNTFYTWPYDVVLTMYLRYGQCIHWWLFNAKRTS